MTTTVDLDPTFRLHVSVPSVRPPRTAVVVCHELFGVNPDIAAVVDDLAAAGLLAIAPELYHRSAPPGRWFARDDAGRSAGFEQLGLVTREDAVADVASVCEWVRREHGIEDVVLLGFSAGGHAAYAAACLLPVRASVVLYAGWLTVTDIPLSRPEPTLGLTPRLSGTMLFLVGERDPLIGPVDRAAIAHALGRERPDHGVVVFEGAEHAYFWKGTPAYDAPARAESWQRILGVVMSSAR